MTSRGMTGMGTKPKMVDILPNMWITDKTKPLGGIE